MTLKMSKENARADGRTVGCGTGCERSAKAENKSEKEKKRRERICTHSSHRSDKRPMFARGANT
jgi:hypothetical protein